MRGNGTKRETGEPRWSNLHKRLQIKPYRKRDLDI